MIRAKITLVYPILFLFTWHFRSVDGRSKDVWAEAVHSMHWVKKIYLSLSQTNVQGDQSTWIAAAAATELLLHTWSSFEWMCVKELVC